MLGPIELSAAERYTTVTHGYFLRTMVARVLLGAALSGEAFQHFHKVAAIENTGLTVLRYHAGVEEAPCWRLWIYNDHAHLADEPTAVLRSIDS